MKKIKIKILIKFLFCCAGMLSPLSHAQEQGKRVQFVACPIVRDTATVPCWLTQYEGTLYYMGIQSDVSADFQPPLQGHQVLVEGTIGSNMICGGLVLDDIKISTMPELDGSCNTVLPAEDRYVIDFNPRPPGPSGGRLAFQANIDPPPPLQPPFDVETFPLFFDFNKSVGFRHPRELMAILTYALDVSAARVEINAFYASHQLSNGEMLTESPDVASRRANEIADLLFGAGLEADITLNWSMAPQAGDGHEDWRGRSAEVTVFPD